MLEGWQYVNKRIDIILDPALAAIPMTLGFNPFEEVVHHLTPHGVCDEDGFLPGEAVGYFDVGFETRKVLVPELEVRVGKAPVVGGGVGGGWIVADAGEVFDDFAPNPVPSDEKIGCVKTLGGSQLNARGIESRVFI